MTPAIKSTKADPTTTPATTPATTPPRPATRTPGRSAIQAYLDVLTSPLPRGRVADVETLRAKFAETSDTVEKLRLVQRIHDAQHRISASDRAKLEEAFIAVAAEWGAANKITWAAWREMGVSAEVLRRARIAH